MAQRTSWLSPAAAAMAASTALPLALLLGLLTLDIRSSGAAETQLATTVDPGRSTVAVTDTDGVRHAGEVASLQVLLRDADGNFVLPAADAAAAEDMASRLSAWSDLELCQGVRHAACPLSVSRYLSSHAAACRCAAERRSGTAASGVGMEPAVLS